MILYGQYLSQYKGIRKRYGMPSNHHIVSSGLKDRVLKSKFNFFWQLLSRFLLGRGIAAWRIFRGFAA